MQTKHFAVIMLQSIQWNYM